MRIENVSDAEYRALSSFISHWPGNNLDPEYLAEQTAEFNEVLDELNGFLSDKIVGPHPAVGLFSSFARMSHLRTINARPIIVVDLTQIETWVSILSMSVGEERPAFAITYFILLYQEYLVSRGAHRFVSFVHQRLMNELNAIQTEQGYIARRLPAEEKYFEWKLDLLSEMHKTAKISIVGHEIGHLLFRDASRRAAAEALITPLVPPHFSITSFKWDILYYTSIKDEPDARKQMDAQKSNLCRITIEEIYADLVQASFVLALLGKDEESASMRFLHLFSIYFYSEFLEVIEYFSLYFAKGKHKLRSLTSQFSVRSRAIVELITDFDRFASVLPLAPDAMESARRATVRLVEDGTLDQFDELVNLKDQILNLSIGLPSLKLMELIPFWKELGLIIGKQEAIDLKAKFFGYGLEEMDRVSERFPNIVRTVVCFGYAYEWLREALVDYSAVFQDFEEVDVIEVERSMYDPWRRVRDSHMHFAMSLLQSLPEGEGTEDGAQTPFES